MARPNGKSVRLSDEALAIVNSAEGEGFNDKFEKLIFAYHNTIPNRLAQLEAIEKRITMKQKEFDRLRKLEELLNPMIRQMIEISEILPNVSNTLNNVSHELSQDNQVPEHIEIQKNKEKINYFLPV